MAGFERRLGAWMAACIAAFVAVVVLHWWQDSLMEDGAWMWSCHTMGDHRCGPHEPLIKIQIGGSD